MDEIDSTVPSDRIRAVVRAEPDTFLRFFQDFPELERLTELQALIVDLGGLLIAAALLLGFISMVTLQIYKELFQARRWYQTSWTRKWIRRNLTGHSYAISEVIWRAVIERRLYGRWEKKPRQVEAKRLRILRKRLWRLSTSSEFDEATDKEIHFWGDSLDRAAKQIWKLNQTLVPQKLSWESLKETRRLVVQIRRALTRTADGKGRSLLGLPAEQLTGHINNVSEKVLDHPASHHSLFMVFSMGADIQDRLIALASDNMQAFFPEHMAALRRLERVKGESVDLELADAIALAREAVTAQAGWNLDEYQLGLTNGWASYQRRVAIGFSVLVALSPVLVLDLQPVRDLDFIIFLVFLGLLGGYLATLIYDLVTVLVSLRSRS